jgi:GTPase SAR1 family protein
MSGSWFGTQLVRRSLTPSPGLITGDTQELWRLCHTSIFRGAKAGIVVFSSTDRQSFNNVSRWKKKLQAECSDIEIVLVRNKVDLHPEIDM